MLFSVNDAPTIVDHDVDARDALARMVDGDANDGGLMRRLLPANFPTRDVAVAAFAVLSIVVSLALAAAGTSALGFSVGSGGHDLSGTPVTAAQVDHGDSYWDGLTAREAARRAARTLDAAHIALNHAVWGDRGWSSSGWAARLSEAAAGLEAAGCDRGADLATSVSIAMQDGRASAGLHDKVAHAASLMDGYC